MNKPEFLPDNPYTRDKSKRLEVNYEPQLYDAWESGSESTFKSLVKWLEQNGERRYFPDWGHDGFCIYLDSWQQLKEWSEK